MDRAVDPHIPPSPDRVSAGRTLRETLPLLAAAAGAFAVLIGLGVWQVERLHWKEALIARLESRRHAAPVPLPLQDQWAGLRPDDFDYRHVTASGVYLPDKTVRVYRGAAPSGGAGEGPGYLIMTSLRLAEGGTVIVNRGFVALDEAKFLPPPGADRVTLTGLMRPPEPRNLFTPNDDPSRDQWFTRDPQAIAAAEGLTDAAPFTIDRDVTAGDPRWPRGGQTVFDIPNNHLSYALTWFGLAATLLGVVAAYLWRGQKRSVA